MASTADTLSEARHRAVSEYIRRATGHTVDLAYVDPASYSYNQHSRRRSSTAKGASSTGKGAKGTEDTPHGHRSTRQRGLVATDAIGTGSVVLVSPAAAVLTCSTPPAEPAHSSAKAEPVGSRVSAVERFCSWCLATSRDHNKVERTADSEGSGSSTADIAGKDTAGKDTVAGGFNNPLLRCSRCKREHYCSTECQLNDWYAGHMSVCKKIAEEGHNCMEPDQEMLVKMLHFLISTEAADATLAKQFANGDDGKAHAKEQESTYEELSGTPKSLTSEEVHENVRVLLDTATETGKTISEEDEDEGVSEVRSVLRHAFHLLKSNHEPENKNAMQIPSCDVEAAEDSANKVSRMKFLKDHTKMINLPKLVDNLLVFRCNNFEVVDSQFFAIGQGTYPLSSLINHSCKPNCIPLFVGSTMVIKSLRDISPGEEIVISYFDTLNTLEVRQGMSKCKYSFQCKCPRCYSDSTTSFMETMDILDALIMGPSVSNDGFEAEIKFNVSLAQSLESDVIDTLCKPLNNVLIEKTDHLSEEINGDAPFNFDSIDEFITTVISSLMTPIDILRDDKVSTQSFKVIAYGQEFVIPTISSAEIADIHDRTVRRMPYILSPLPESPVTASMANISPMFLDLGVFKDVSSMLYKQMETGNWKSSTRLALYILSYYMIFYESFYHPLIALQAGLVGKVIWNCSESYAQVSEAGCSVTKEELILVDLAEYFLIEAIRRLSVVYVYDGKSQEFNLDEYESYPADRLTSLGAEKSDLKPLFEPIINFAKVLADINKFKQQL